MTKIGRYTTKTVSQGNHKFLFQQGVLDAAACQMQA